MRFTALGIAMVFLAGCHQPKTKPVAEVKVEGVVFSPKDGKCEVWFPSEPHEREIEPGKRIFDVATEQKGRYVLLVAANEKPVDIKDEAAVGKVFESGKEAFTDFFAKKKKGHIELKDKFTFADKFPAIHFEISTGKTKGIPGFLVLTPTHIYGVGAAGPKEFVESGDVKKFMESLHVKE